MKRVMILTGAQTIADVDRSLLSVDDGNYWFHGLLSLVIRVKPSY
jgi:hypothetical protein